MKEKELQEQIEEHGEFTVEHEGVRIHVLSIIGEVEGHECLSSNVKTTKYDQILPQLAEVEQNEKIDGLLVLLNTVGGDVDAGLAIAEMIASVSKPSVSLVLGGSHSIGVPLAVSTDYSFIVPSGTVILHPVRLTGVVIGAPQTYEYFQLIQDRIVEFITTHSRSSKARIEQQMMQSGVLTKDLGTILVGHQAVAEGIIDEVGGISEAYAKLKEMIVHRENFCYNKD
jgi:ATP-dependent protease ClpP protease subunit